MKIKTYNYHITVLLIDNKNVKINSSFVIQSISVSETQAFQIAKILYPDYIIKKIELTSNNNNI